MEIDQILSLPSSSNQAAHRYSGAGHGHMFWPRHGDVGLKNIVSLSCHWRPFLFLLLADVSIGDRQRTWSSSSQVYLVKARVYQVTLNMCCPVLLSPLGDWSSCARHLCEMGHSAPARTSRTSACSAVQTVLVHLFTLSNEPTFNRTRNLCHIRFSPVAPCDRCCQPGG